MLTDITLGQFFPGNSPIHRMDARVKIVLLFFYIVAVFLFDNNLNYAIMTGGAAILVLLSGLPGNMVLKSVKPLWWIILFSFLLRFNLYFMTICVSNCFTSSKISSLK